MNCRFAFADTEFLKVLVISILASHATMVFAERDFSCSRNSICVINDSNVVMGDELGFFTDQGELIATGRVTKMQGSKRSVKLQQVSGSVNTYAESYAMLDGARPVRQEQYKIFRQPSKISLASHFGLSSFGAGGDIKGMEGSVEGLRKKFLGKLDGVVQGGVFSYSGTARNIYGEKHSDTFNMTSLAFTGGLSYGIFDQNDVFLRTEAGLGVSYTMAKIGGSPQDAQDPDWGLGVKSGFAPHIRGLLVSGYRFNGWQLEAGAAPSLLAGKPATTIGAGVLVNLK